MILGTLRRRLIVSHVLPLLIIIPLMGIGLVYLLETRVLLPIVTAGLEGYGSLVAEVSTGQPDVWRNPEQIRAFVANISKHVSARVMLLDSSGRVLASSEPTDTQRIGQPLDRPGLARALAGQISWQADYSPFLRSDVAEVFVPVLTGQDHQVQGVVRLSYRLAGVEGQFIRLRYFIIGILAVGLLLGSTAGWVLAVNTERPLDRLTRAVRRLATGGQFEPLVEQGPEEINLLLQAFNSLVKRMRSLEEARRRLLANLVHELGRPLGALFSAVEALQAGADEDARLHQELLDGMGAEILRLQRLLDDLARLHDQVLGTLELNRQPTALSDWLTRALATWREAAQGKGLHWRVTAAPDLPILDADPDRLAQALGNLLSNALKYTPRDGTVSVDAGVTNEQAWIRVSDTGPGIAPEEFAHLFTPFHRGQQEGRFHEGMGLGLSIARDLVLAHGGRIDVDSTPGLGSRFTIWLPLTFDNS